MRRALGKWYLYGLHPLNTLVVSSIGLTFGVLFAVEFHVIDLELMALSAIDIFDVPIMFTLLVGKPWLGFFSGVAAGTVFALLENRYVSRNVERLTAQHEKRSVQYSFRGSFVDALRLQVPWTIGVAVVMALSVANRMSLVTVSLGMLSMLWVTCPARRALYLRVVLARARNPRPLDRQETVEQLQRAGRRYSLRIAAVALILQIGAVLYFAMASPIPRHFHFDLVSLYGTLSLTAAEAARFEEKLAADPENPDLRYLLLSYYGFHHDDGRFDVDSGTARKRYASHALWFIEHRPADRLTNNISLSPHLDGESYESAKRLWLRHIEQNSRNLAILMNAADFFEIDDIALAEELVKRGFALEPDNPEWGKRLGRILAIRLRDTRAE